MAKKGTYSAYSSAQPIQEDFGGIAQDIAQGFVDQKNRELNLKLKDLAAKKAQQTANAKQAKDTFNNMRELSKLSEDFINLKPIQGAQEMTSVLIANGIAENAELMREYQNADYSRQIEIENKIRTMASWGRQWNEAVADVNTIMTETASGMGTTYDEVYSTPMVKDLVAAIKSGSEFGAVSQGKGKIGYGKYITVEDIGNGSLNVSFKGSDGKEIFAGSMSEIAGKIAQGRQAFVDTDKEFFTNFGEGQAADIFGSANPFGNLLKTSRGTNETSTKNRLREQFRTQYMDVDDKGVHTNKFMQKSVRLGEDPDKVMEDAVDLAYNRMKKEATASIKANPEWSGRAKQMNLDSRFDAINGVLEADPKFANRVKGRNWKGKGIVKEVSREGNILTVQYEGRDAKNKKITLAEDVDLSNPNEREGAAYIANELLIQAGGDATVSFDGLRQRYAQGGDYLLRTIPEVSAEGGRTAEQLKTDYAAQAEEIKSESGNADSKVKKVINSNYEAILSSKGYTVDVDTASKFGKAVAGRSSDIVTIKDKDGKVVKKIQVKIPKGGGKENLMKSVGEYLNSLTGAEPEKKEAEPKEEEEEAKKEISTGGAY